MHLNKEVFTLDCPGSLLRNEFLKGSSTKWSFTQQAVNNTKQLTVFELCRFFLFNPTLQNAPVGTSNYRTPRMALLGKKIKSLFWQWG